MSFHILFPAFSIGLAWWLVFLEAVWIYVSKHEKSGILPRFSYKRSRQSRFTLVESADGAADSSAHPGADGSDFWRDLYFFWMKAFAVAFGMGVVSGIVMSFQFGTNWARYSELAGNVVGPLLNYEVLTAFFLGSDVSRRHAVRLEQGQPTYAFLRDLHGRDRHVDLELLDHRGEQLDADASRLRDAGRRVRADQLVGNHFQSVVPVSPRAHGARGIHHDRIRRRWRCGKPSAARQPSCACASDAETRARVYRDYRARADFRRRSFRPHRARVPTDEACRNRGTLGYRTPCAADPVRVA